MGPCASPGGGEAVLQGREALAGRHIVQEAQRAGEHSSVLLLPPGLGVHLDADTTLARFPKALAAEPHMSLQTRPASALSRPPSNAAAVFFLLVNTTSWRTDRLPHCGNLFHRHRSLGAVHAKNCNKIAPEWGFPPLGPSPGRGPGHAGAPATRMAALCAPHVLLSPRAGRPPGHHPVALLGRPADCASPGEQMRHRQALSAGADS